MRVLSRLRSLLFSCALSLSACRSRSPGPEARAQELARRAEAVSLPAVTETLAEPTARYAARAVLTSRELLVDDALAWQDLGPAGRSAWRAARRPPWTEALPFGRVALSFERPFGVALEPARRDPSVLSAVRSALEQLRWLSQGRPGAAGSSPEEPEALAVVADGEAPWPLLRRVLLASRGAGYGAAGLRARTPAGPRWIQLYYSRLPSPAAAEDNEALVVVRPRAEGISLTAPGGSLQPGCRSVGSRSAPVAPPGDYAALRSCIAALRSVREWSDLTVRFVLDPGDASRVFDVANLGAVVSAPREGATASRVELSLDLGARP